MNHKHQLLRIALAIAGALVLMGATCKGKPTNSVPGQQDACVAAPDDWPSKGKPSTDLLKGGEACLYGDDCLSTLCVPDGQASYCAGVGIDECERKFAAAGTTTGVLTDMCGTDQVHPYCVKSSATEPSCAGECAAGDECARNADCGSGWCYVPLPKLGAAGVCVDILNERCPEGHEAKLFSKTDPVTLCIPVSG
ncbi:MAG: hypothetical protein Tsb0020_38160 [Haliangiales bacterium]